MSCFIISVPFLSRCKVFFYHSFLDSSVWSIARWPSFSLKPLAFSLLKLAWETLRLRDREVEDEGWPTWSLEIRCVMSKHDESTILRPISYWHQNSLIQSRRSGTFSWLRCSAWNSFLKLQFDIFPAELHLGIVKTYMTVELFPKEVRP